MKLVLITLLALVSIVPLRAERDVVFIFQPLSLLGTELEAYPLGRDQPVSAEILATPAIVSSAYPEAIVAAIALPHQFYNAPQGFPEESNLIVLTGGRLEAVWGEKNHSVTIDFSKVVIKDRLGITLKQLCDLTLLCLSKSLEEGHTDGKGFDLNWKLPPAVKLDLPSTLKFNSVEQGAAVNP